MRRTVTSTMAVALCAVAAPSFADSPAAAPVTNAPSADPTSKAVASSAQVVRTHEVTFAYEQKRYLFSRQGKGGLAFSIEADDSTAGIAAGAPHQSLPVVVFLHGMNARQEMHPWASTAPESAGWDLRPALVDMVKTGKVAPFVLVAPTHTRWATAANVMWPRFEVDGLLDAAETAIGKRATLDRQRVILVGHSGAGCNPTGGIVAVPTPARATLRAIVAVDGCLDADLSDKYSELATRTSVFFFHQPAWPRPIDLLERACEARGVPCTIEKLDGLGGAAHNAILPVALARVLPRLLPPRASSPSRLTSSPATALRAPHEP